jgi:hypothetical protein
VGSGIQHPASSSLDMSHALAAEPAELLHPI